MRKIIIKIERLQARQGRDTKEKFAENTQDYDGKSDLFQPHEPRTVLRSNSRQQKQPQPPSITQTCTTSLEALPTTSTKSVSSGS
jgi:hypothetical protein